MKKLEEFTDQEKIEKFNKMYEMCLDEINESRQEDYDEHYFWEGVIEEALELTNEDWRNHNSGERL